VCPILHPPGPGFYLYLVYLLISIILMQVLGYHRSQDTVRWHLQCFQAASVAVLVRYTGDCVLLSTVAQHSELVEH
jgi:hypothetical protein